MVGGPSASTTQRFDIPSCATGNGRATTTVDIVSYKSSNSGALGIIGAATFTAPSMALYNGNEGSGAGKTGYRNTLLLTSASGDKVASSPRGAASRKSRPLRPVQATSLPIRMTPPTL